MLQNEAMTKENFERQEKGLPILKPTVEPRPVPIMPVIEKELTIADIPDGYEVNLESAKKHILKNEVGVMFIGYDVNIDLFPSRKKKKPGRPKESDKIELEPLTLEGWMFEGKFLEFIRTYRKQIDQQVIIW
jgi:hypothetical protein